MSLVGQIEVDLKAAMKAQNPELTGILRMLKSAIKNMEISVGHELSDSEAMTVLEKQAKQRRDSIEQFISGNRQDLADIESAELLLIEKYLPTKMTTVEVEEIVKTTIIELGATSAADMGKVIQTVMAKTAGATDGKTVSSIVRENL